MGMLRGGQGLFCWRDGWAALPCPLARADFVAAQHGAVTALDDGAHQLWHGGRVLPCDREVAALSLWQGHALVLSGDTDCLSLADGDGWLRTARVGVYPQDMAVLDDAAWVCGGADGQVHRLTLPVLQGGDAFPAPGMAERIACWDDQLWLLCLQAEEDAVQTLLVQLDSRTGQARTIARLPGLPGAIAANAQGVWAAAGERLYHFAPWQETADAVIDGFSLIRHMDLQGDTVLVTDPLAGLIAQVTGETVHVLARGDVGQAVFV